MSQPWRSVAAGLALLLVGCASEHPSEHLFRDYQQRLANILEIDEPEATQNSDGYLLPRREQRLKPLTDFRISAWDYLQTYECSLNLLISERNSSLGKVMPATRRLAYETSLIIELRLCIEKLAQSPEADKPLIDELSAVLVPKKRELKRALWNAKFAGPEFEKFASLASAPLDPADLEPMRIASQALDELYRLSLQVQRIQAEEHDVALTAEAIETPLHRLATQQSLGRWQQSVWLVVRALPLASALLMSDEAQSRLCPQGVATKKARYLQNVFHKHFVAKLQPYLSQLERQGLATIEKIDQLLQLHQPTPDDPLVIYLEKLKELLNAPHQPSFDNVVQEHVVAWQQLFRGCGMSPAR